MKIPTRLLLAGSFIGAAVTAIVGLGGPEEAWLKVSWMWRGHPAPTIIKVAKDPEHLGFYIATLKNPALEEVAITGYQAGPVAPAIDGSDLASAPASNDDPTVTDIQEEAPEDCMAVRKVPFAKPILIDSRRRKGVRFHPWREPCGFGVFFESDHGETEASFVWDRERLKGLVR